MGSLQVPTGGVIGGGGGGIADLPVAPNVIDIQTAPPGAPNSGDRYIVQTPGSGAWTGQDENIAEWNGASWDFTTEEQGTLVFVENQSEVYIFLGGDWVPFDATVDLNVGVTQIQNGTANGLLYEDGSTTLQNGSVLTFDGSQVSVSDVPNQIALMSGNQGFEHLIGAGPDSVVNVNANSIDLFDNLQNGLQASVQAGFFGTTDNTGSGTAQLQSIDGGISVAGVQNNGFGTYVRLWHDPSVASQASHAIEWFDFNGNNLFWYDYYIQLVDSSGAGHQITMNADTPRVEVSATGGSQRTEVNASSVNVIQGAISSSATAGQVAVRDNGTNNVLTMTTTPSLVFNVGGTSSNLLTAHTATRNWTLPDNSGTIALTSDIPAGGLTIGDAISGGAVNRVLYEGAGNVLAESVNFTYNGTGMWEFGTPSNPAGGRGLMFNFLVGANDQLEYKDWANTYFHDIQLRGVDIKFLLDAGGVGGGAKLFVNENGNQPATQGMALDATNYTVIGGGVYGGANTGTLDFNFSSLTASRTWTMPDQSGTVALTSDIPAGGLTIGDSIASGAANSILFEDGSNQLAEATSLTFNGVTNTPEMAITGSISAILDIKTGITTQLRIEGRSTDDVLFRQQGAILMEFQSGNAIGLFGKIPVGQASKINDPSGGATVDAESRTAINAIIDALEGIGISALV